MRQSYTLESAFLVVVLTVSVTGFSSLFPSGSPALTGYHVLHMVTSMAWLLLLLAQLLCLRQRRAARHRTIGTGILAAGPMLITSVSLLTAHSAAKEAAVGAVDRLVVQNVTFTLELSLLLLLAGRFRHDRSVHGALLLSTALMFLVIALFFTLISYVPGYRVDGPETVGRFAASAQVSAMIGSAVGILFFLRQGRKGWPWLLTSVFFILDGYLQVAVERAGHTKALTMAVGSLGEGAVLGAAALVSTGLVWVAWTSMPTRPGRREAEVRP